MHKIRSQIKQVQLSPINMDTEEAMKSVPINLRCVCIKKVEFRENLRAFFPLRQSELSRIMRCLY